jgi:hypothetical protein
MNQRPDPLLLPVVVPQLPGLLEALAGSGALVLQLMDQGGRILWASRPLLGDGASEIGWLPMTCRPAGFTRNCSLSLRRSTVVRLPVWGS